MRVRSQWQPQRYVIVYVSPTLATLIDRINQTRTGHIITIEDPIEYLHKSNLSLVDQREVGQDTESFNEALVASMRQDPDVILVGEIRDLNTIRTAITAAETGHLVFATVHAGDCVGSIDRLVSNCLCNRAGDSLFPTISSLSA